MLIASNNQSFRAQSLQRPASLGGFGLPGMGGTLDQSAFSPEALGGAGGGLGNLGFLMQALGGDMDPTQLRILQLQQEIPQTEAALQQAQAQGNEPAVQQLGQRLQQLQAELQQLTNPTACQGGEAFGPGPGSGPVGGGGQGSQTFQPSAGNAPAAGFSPSGPVQNSPTVSAGGGNAVGDANLGRLKTLQEAKTLDDGSLAFKAGAAIDVDGSGGAHGDPCKQWETSLKTRDGKSLNADTTPYFVLPPQVAKQYGIKPGDLGTISYNGKTIPAIFGDVGPKNKIGEVSRYAAQQLGINASPTKGGVSSGVQYNVFPGSGSRRPSAADVTPGALAQRVTGHQQMLAQRSGGSSPNQVASNAQPARSQPS